MIGMLLLSFGVAIGSALIPVVNVEIFVLAAATAQHDQGPPWWAVGAVVAIGQVLGKLLYFYAARGDMRLPAFIHRKTEAAMVAAPRRECPEGSVFRRAWHTAKVWFTWIREKCHEHPKWMFGTHTVSSVLGLPPFFLTTVLAGFSGMSLGAFLLASLPGRFLRFALLALFPGVVFGHHLFA
nr:membrane protein [Sciscionella sp. SE31]